MTEISSRNELEWTHARPAPNVGHVPRLAALAVTEQRDDPAAAGHENARRDLPASAGDRLHRALVPR